MPPWEVYAGSAVTRCLLCHYGRERMLLPEKEAIASSIEFQLERADSEMHNR